MSLRFNHVFLALLIFCALTAFIIPRYVDPARAQFQNIFYPVSRPARAAAQLLRGRFDHQRIPDPASPATPRSDEDVRQENLALRQMVASLTVQLQKLQERESQRAALGKLRNLCVPFNVVGGDAGVTESLLIGGSSLDHLRAGMAVVYPGGLAGRLDTPGVAGTRVRLVTDRGFGMTGYFIRLERQPNRTLIPVRIESDQLLARGIGSNTLAIELLAATAKKIQINDWFILDDPEPDWPAAVQGQFLGRVVRPPAASLHSPGYDVITIQPAANLMQLREVLVVVRR